MSDCILYDGYIRRDGYGQRGSQYAHRVAWIAVHGEIPRGKVVRHTCDIRACVNVEHLQLGTQRDNIRDRQDRGRQARGLANARTKLTEEDIRAVRASDLSSRALAKQLGVSHTSVLWARKGLTALSRQVSD